MNTLFLTLTIINFIFIFDIIFLNSYCIKKVRNCKKYFPDVVKNSIMKLKFIVYIKLYNEEERKEKFKNGAFENSQLDLSLIESAEKLKEEIIEYIDKKPNIFLENYPPFQTVYQLKSRIKKLSANENYILETIKNELKKIDYNLIEDKNLITHYIEIMNLLQSYESIHYSYKNGMKEFYDTTWKELINEINKFRRLNEVLKNAKTSHVYLKAERAFSLAFYIYSGLSIITIFIIMKFSLFILEQKRILIDIYQIDTYDYWALKITSLFVSITLITFFIKQAIHFQKKKDLAQRIRLELDALPTYIFDMDEKDKKNIRKELIPKYFGNSNDNSTLNEIGNIVTEQLKTSSDVAKSSADIIKALKNKI